MDPVAEPQVVITDVPPDVPPQIQEFYDTAREEYSDRSPGLKFKVREDDGMEREFHCMMLNRMTPLEFRQWIDQKRILDEESGLALEYTFHSKEYGLTQARIMTLRKAHPSYLLEDTPTY